jgi:alpha-L-fucosidase
MKPQLRELVTLSEIDALVHGDGSPTGATRRGRRSTTGYTDATELIINNRVGPRAGDGGMSANKNAPGDFGTPEQRVPPRTSRRGLETCMTSTTHGDSSRSTTAGRTKLSYGLVDVASKGGTCCSTWPDGAGLISRASRLREMNDWTRANGEAIYGTTASPYGLPAWGRYTARPSARKVYAHVSTAQDQAARAHWRDHVPRSATCWPTGSRCRWSRGGAGS